VSPHLHCFARLVASAPLHRLLRLLLPLLPLIRLLPETACSGRATHAVARRLALRSAALPPQPQRRHLGRQGAGASDGRALTPTFSAKRRRSAA
jgi:hypothetical protein